jgi:hypothetical protein
MYLNNNLHSKYIIINLKVIDIDYKFHFQQFNNILIDWIDESLLKNYNNELNWNIGIIYPPEFSLTTCTLPNKLNTFHSLENKIIKIFLYLDSTIYPSFNENKLIYTNKYSLNNPDFIIKNTNMYGIKINNIHTKLNDIVININKLITSLNINSGLLTLNNPKFIYSISISGVPKETMLYELNLLKLGNKFINYSSINDFIYLKNIYSLGHHYLINCDNAFNKFYDNFLYSN